MASTEVTRLTDPVCGMSVRLDAATADGLTLEHEGTLYAFCRTACLEAFRANPHAHGDSAHAHAPAAEAPAGRMATGQLPVIDEGMRRWYDSCSCCLGDTYPEVKAALDEERRAHAQPVASDGICEVAEAAEA
jgi:YHS domain-containing protein